jgi:preprotein translocase subunit YajC
VLDFLLDLLVPAAYAQQGAAPAPSGLAGFLAGPGMLLVMLPLFYFILIRPQMKRSKEARQMLSSLAKGDEAVTNGGLAGRIVNIGEVYLTLEVADNVQVKVLKSAVSSVLPKGTLKSL